MGGGQSSTAQQFVETYLSFEATTKTIIDLQSSINATGITSQNITIVIGNANTENVVIDSINGTQRSVQNAKIIQQLCNKTDLKQVRDIQQNVMNDLQTTNKQVQEYLNLSFLGAGSSSNTTQIIQNAISTSVYDTVNFQSINRVFLNLRADQDGYVNIQGRNITIGNITFNQDVLFEIAAQQLVETALSSVMATSAVQDVENQVIAYLKQQQTGVKDIGRAGALVVNGLLSGLMPIFIILAVLAAGGAGFYIYYSNSKKHPKIHEHDITKAVHKQEEATSTGPVFPEVKEAKEKALDALHNTGQDLPHE